MPGTIATTTAASTVRSRVAASARRGRLLRGARAAHRAVATNAATAGTRLPSCSAGGLVVRKVTSAGSRSTRGSSRNATPTRPPRASTAPRARSNDRAGVAPPSLDKLRVLDPLAPDCHGTEPDRIARRAQPVNGAGAAIRMRSPNSSTTIDRLCETIGATVSTPSRATKSRPSPLASDGCHPAVGTPVTSMPRRTRIAS